MKSKKKIKEFLKKHVILTAVLSGIAYVIIAIVVRMFMPNEKAETMYLNGDPSLNILISDVVRIAVLLFALPVMFFLGTFKKSGLHTTKGIGTGLLLGSGMVLFSWAAATYSMADSIKICMQGGVFSWSDCKFAGIGLTVLILVTCLLIGIMEETLCRGIMFLNMVDKWGNSRRGLWKAIVLAALPFGLLHFMNLTAAVKGIEVWTIVFQVIYATTFAIFAGVLYLRCKNIWALILIHGLIDFAQYILFLFIPSGKSYEMEQFDKITSDNLASVSIFYGVFALGFLVTALVMFRKVKVDEKGISGLDSTEGYAVL